MKRTQRMARILSAAKKAQTQLERVHAELQTNRRAALARLERVDEELAAAFNTPVSHPHAELALRSDHARGQRAANNAKELIRDEIRVLDDTRISPTRTALDAATQHRRSIQRLVDRQIEAERRRAERDEQAVLDEFGQRRYGMS